MAQNICTKKKQQSFYCSSLLGAVLLDYSANNALQIVTTHKDHHHRFQVSQQTHNYVKGRVQKNKKNGQVASDKRQRIYRPS